MAETGVTLVKAVAAATEGAAVAGSVSAATGAVEGAAVASVAKTAEGAAGGLGVEGLKGVSLPDAAGATVSGDAGVVQIQQMEAGGPHAGLQKLDELQVGSEPAASLGADAKLADGAMVGAEGTQLGVDSGAPQVDDSLTQSDVEGIGPAEPAKAPDRRDNTTGATDLSDALTSNAAAEGVGPAEPGEPKPASEPIKTDNMDIADFYNAPSSNIDGARPDTAPDSQEPKDGKEDEEEDIDKPKDEADDDAAKADSEAGDLTPDEVKAARAGIDQLNAAIESGDTAKMAAGFKELLPLLQKLITQQEKGAKKEEAEDEEKIGKLQLIMRIFLVMLSYMLAGINAAGGSAMKK